MKRVKQNTCKILAIICALSLVVISCTVIASAADYPDYLGKLTDYNAVIFGNLEATQADIEGSVAVKGNMNTPSVPDSSYSVAASTTAAYNIMGSVFDNKTPALILGGALTINNSNSHFAFPSNGTAVFADSSSAATFTNEINDNTVTVKQESAATVNNFFAAESSLANSVISKSAAFSTSSPISGASLGIGVSKQDSKVLVSSNLNDSSLNLYGKSNYGAIDIPNLDNYDCLVIYSTAPSVSFNGSYNACTSIYYETSNGTYVLVDTMTCPQKSSR